MDEHVSAKFIVSLFRDWYDESINTVSDSIDNGDVLVNRDVGKCYFRYISGNRIKESVGLNYFVHGDTLYYYNQYFDAYDFIENKIKEVTDKSTFDWVKNLVIIHPSTNEEIKKEYLDRGYEIVRWKRRYRRLSKEMLIGLFIYGITLVCLGGAR